MVSGLKQQKCWFRWAIMSCYIGRNRTKLKKVVKGQYFDNDIGQFANPHPDALDPHKCKKIVSTINTVLAKTI